MLKLECPAHSLPSRPESNQHRRQSDECHYHTERIEHAVHTLLLTGFTHILGEAHRLDGQHRKDAGHQIENQASKEGEPHKHE